MPPPPQVLTLADHGSSAMPDALEDAFTTLDWLWADLQGIDRRLVMGRLGWSWVAPGGLVRQGGLGPGQGCHHGGKEGAGEAIAAHGAASAKERYDVVGAS